MTETTTPGRDHIEQVIEIIRDTEAGGLLSDCRADGLSGISGLKTVGVLQRLARLFDGESEACYLEIGVFSLLHCDIAICSFCYSRLLSGLQAC